MTVQKSECPVAAGQIAEQSTNKVGIVAPELAEDNKARATLIAAYAFAGYSVHQLSDGGFLVARWNLSKHCPDLRALEGFARLIGVRQ